MLAAAYIEIPLRQSKSTTKFGFTFQQNVITKGGVIVGEYFYQDNKYRPI
jgi:hypothetical protein